MNIFGFHINISRAAGSAATPTRQKALALTPAEWLRGVDLGPRPSSLSSAYEQVVWVYRAINVLAEQVANIPFLFSAGERGRENLITAGPLLDFYARPHPQVNRFQYWELRVIWLMLRGECIRVPIFEDGTRNTQHAARRLARILILDPARFQHIIADHRLIGWRYTGLGPQAPLASQVFLPEEIWFEKLPNPFDFWRGLSPLAVAAMAAGTDFAASAFMQGIIENNADTGVIVRSDKPLSDEQQDQVLAALRERKRRAGQADRPVFLNAVTEIVKPQLSSSDLQFLENRKFSRAEICAAFGVPEEIVTTTDFNKYDVMTGARLNFIENRVAPLCGRLEAEEEVTVKSLDPRASGWFDLDSLPIMQEARRSRLAAAKTGFDMGIPLNELNRVLDLGFKPLPWGDRGYLAAKLQEVGNDSSKSKVQSPKSGGASPQATVHSPQSPACAGQMGPGGEAGQRVASVELEGPLARAERLLSELNRSRSPALDPRSLTGKLRRFLFEQRQRALANLLPRTGQIGQTSQTGPANPTTPLLDLAAENAQLAASLKTILAEPAQGAIEQFNQTTLAGLEQVVQEGLSEGESADQLAGRIRALYNEAAARRAPEFAQAAFVPGGAGNSAGELQPAPPANNTPEQTRKDAGAPGQPNP